MTSASDGAQPVGFPARLKQLAASRPDNLALTLVYQDGRRESLTFAELQHWANTTAQLLREQGVDADATVIVAVGNSLEHFAATWGAWLLGALVLPLNVRATSRERDGLIELSSARVVVSDWVDVAGPSRKEIRQARSRSVVDLPGIIPSPGKAVCSGGSTGRPKIIIDPAPLARVPGESLGIFGRWIRFYDATVQAVPGPVFHNMPFTWSAYGLFEGQHLIVMERFEAGALVDLIEQERVEFMTVVPTMMRRVAELADVRSRDFSSLMSVLHSAAPCPEPLKRAWIDLVGPEVLWEGFGATENVGVCLIRGDEWLAHPGSVGRPVGALMKLLDENGEEVSTGEVGEVFMRPDAPGETFRYVGGTPAKTMPDGFVSVGDLGSVDADGYLFPADRRVDLIISGGANVYPAEVEAVLLEHADVADAVVIGLPDPDWGKRVHAVVAPYPGQAAPTEHDLAAWCRQALAPYKVPKAFEVLPELPRDEAGKIRRRALVDERSMGGPS